ncbi:hypothetical protein V8G54_002892 [Vigna mungo]|uniref:Sulfotransferase n=1 Tax=Vigna mungo TaxID=3915 RepID=A0AAQ3SCD6_VIGMU
MVLKDMCLFNKVLMRGPHLIKPFVLSAVSNNVILKKMNALSSLCIFRSDPLVLNISTHARTMLMELQSEKPSRNRLGLTDVPLLHYPNPVSFNRSECAGNPVRFFAILSNQRSGSGWFETLLNSHINVSSNGEIFSVRERRVNVSTIVQTLDKVYNLDWFSSASKNECSAAVGLKWMLNQGLMEHPKEIADYFNRRVVDLKDMEKRMAKALEYFSINRHMILYYEDLIRNRTKLKDVQDFLGLPQMELRSRQIKIHRGALSDHIKNWDDVNKTLHGTAYECFLQTDYSS